MKCMIVAYDQQRGIGADNDMMWQRDLPADLLRFRSLTMGNTLVMGRKTFDSIGHALKGRQNIVVTHRPLDVPNVEVAASLEEAYALATNTVFVIGGSTIYSQALNDMDILYATEVGETFSNATVFFPTIDDAWYEAEREHHEPDDKNKYPYDYVVYKRVA